MANNMQDIQVINYDDIHQPNFKLKPIRTKKKKDIGNDLDHDAKKEVEEEEDEEGVLSPASRMFHEPNYNIHIIAIMGWRGEPRVDVIKENLAKSIVNQPRFSSLQVKDETDKEKIKWVPTAVNLDNHIIIPDLDPNMESPDKFVDDYITNLSKTPLDMSKPLWDLHILIIKTSDSDAVSIFRVHHSLGDGVSLVSILLANTRKTSDPNSLPTFPAKKTKNSNRSKKGVIRHYFTRFWLLLRVLMHTIIDMFMFMATAMFLKDTETPIKSPLEKGPPQARFIRRTVCLDDIKYVKNATNATINDVVLGVTQAGLSRYLNRRYCEAESTKEQQAIEHRRNMIPKRIRFRATVLVNLRAIMGLTALTDQKSEKMNTVVTEHGNCFGFVLLPFKISMAQNPIDHVRQAKAIMDRKKQSLEVVCTSYILELVLKFFGFKGATTLARRVPSQTTLTFSNVMGPLEEISYCGHPMTYLSATCYGQPTGLMIHVVSYTDKLNFAISVDERTIADPYQLGDDIVESLELMKRAIFEETKAKDD